MSTSRSSGSQDAAASKCSAALPECNHQPTEYTGPPRDELLALRQTHVAPSVFTYYANPIAIVEGSMQYLWDDTGKRYLDGIGGVVTVSVGHCHPHVVKAIRDQVGKLMHTTTIYLHPTIAKYARKLADHFPEDSGLESTYFANSGSEANDLATMTARMHTGHFDVIALRNGYHGGTQTTMGLTAMGNWKFPFPHSFGVKHATPGYCYRCPLGLEYPSCKVRCAQDVASLIEYETSGKIAAFIAETIQGAGGVVDPPPEYFKIVYDIVRAHGGLCIADEVQTGFGRLGTHFWGFEAFDVVPDMVVMAKGIGNGVPLSAVTTRREIAETMAQKLHFNTFGGNPVSVSAGLATLEVIDDEHLQKNALEVGTYLKNRLVELQKTQPLIGDVRGRGLMLGVELVRDRETKEPAKQESASVHEGTKDRGLLIGRGGIHGNVLRIKPPMCITQADADFLVDCLDETLSSIV